MDIFKRYVDYWELEPDGEPFETHSSHLFLVIYKCVPAMLRIARQAEEERGNGLMAWWQGEGAARVLEHEGCALLMERAAGPSLKALVAKGKDDQASRIICEVAAKFHRPRAQTPPRCVPLREWFRDLKPAAKIYGGVLRQCWEIADELLSNPLDEHILHGDLHHGNILDFGGSDWRAIDPKGLIGERGFEFANLFCNPDEATAMRPGRLAQQVEIVSGVTGIERKRLLQWIAAWSALSTVWMVQDGWTERPNLTVSQIALDELLSY